LVPVRRARVRSQSSTVIVGGAPSSLHGLPFNRNRTAVMARAHTKSRAATATTADTLARRLARLAPSRIAAICNGPARCAAWLCTLFWQQWPSGPWHDRARPATSRGVLAARPVGLPEHSARSLHRRAGTDGAFAAPDAALRRRRGDDLAWRFAAAAATHW